MEWTAFNVIITILFALFQNAAFYQLKKAEKASETAICTIIILIVYAAMLWYLLTKGASMQQTLLVLLLSLPVAFLPEKKHDACEKEGAAKQKEKSSKKIKEENNK